MTKSAMMKWITEMSLMIWKSKNINNKIMVPIKKKIYKYKRIQAWINRRKKTIKSMEKMKKARFSIHLLKLFLSQKSFLEELIGDKE